MAYTNWRIVDAAILSEFINFVTEQHKAKNIYIHNTHVNNDLIVQTKYSNKIIFLYFSFFFLLPVPHKWKFFPYFAPRSVPMFISNGNK